MGSRAVAKAHTRAKVLACARDLFADRGYEGTTIRDVAIATGMSTGAIFANFKDKADLFLIAMGREPPLSRLRQMLKDAAFLGPGTIMPGDARQLLADLDGKR